MKRISITMLLFLLSMSCYVSGLSARRGSTQQDNKPEWLINPQSRYPQGMYLVAIGEGDNRRRAEADAARNLAKIFETKVETEELFRERYQEIVSESSVQSEISTDIDSSIALSASQTLYNIQYADSYTDELGRVSVLAYIDRHKTADIYMDKISNHSDQIRIFLEQAERTESLLHEYAYRSAATVISTANETLLEQLQVIAPDYKAMLMLDYDHNELLLETRKLAQNISFSVTIVDDHDQDLCSVVRDMLTGHGFVIDETGDVKIKGEVVVENVDLQRPEKFVRWHLNLEMQDDQGNTLISHSQRGREGHVNQSEAVARAYRALEREIRQEFNRKLFSYFDKLVN
jgi:hypothetical protein